MTDVTEMPSNLSAEKAVLSAMMFSEKLYRQGLAEGIDEDSFNFPTNQILFEVLKTLGQVRSGERSKRFEQSRVCGNQVARF